MATEQKEATQYTCDNPKCAKQFIHVEGEELPFGYYIDFSVIHGGGGDGGQDIFACKKSCIVPAMEAVR